MLYHIYVCVNCREEFEPADGDSKDYCSWDCVDEHEEKQLQEQFSEDYNQAFGRRVL